MVAMRVTSSAGRLPVIEWAATASGPRAPSSLRRPTSHKQMRPPISMGVPGSASGSMRGAKRQNNKQNDHGRQRCPCRRRAAIDGPPVGYTVFKTTYVVLLHNSNFNVGTTIRSVCQ